MWLILALLRRAAIEVGFFSGEEVIKRQEESGKQGKLNNDLRLADRIVAHYRLPQEMFQEDNTQAKLVEGLTAFATRRGFLQTAASACGAFGLALLGADVASGVSAYCCGLCLSPSTCTSCVCTWSWTCVYNGDGCTYSCTELPRAKALALQAQQQLTVGRWLSRIGFFRFLPMDRGKTYRLRCGERPSRPRREPKRS